MLPDMHFLNLSTDSDMSFINANVTSAARKLNFARMSKFQHTSLPSVKAAERAWVSPH